MRLKKIEYYLYFFIVIGCVSFNFVQENAILQPLFSILTYLILGSRLFIWVSCYHSKKVEGLKQLDLMVLLFWIVLLISTIKNGLNFQPVFGLLRNILLLRLLIFGDRHKNNVIALRCLSNLFIVLIGLNLFLLILVPGLFGTVNSAHGTYNKLLLAINYNQLGGFFIPAIIVGYISYYKSKYFEQILIFLCAFTALYCGSMNTTTCMLAIALAYYFRNHKFISKAALTFAFIMLPFFFFIYVIPIFTSNIDSIVNPITDFLGKDMNFSGRTPIWIMTMEHISHLDFWGVGYFDSKWFSDNVMNGPTHAHNIILNVILQTGYVGFAIFVFCFVLSIKSMFKNGDKQYKWFFLTILTVFLWMNMFEVYIYPYIFLVLYSLYYAPEYISIKRPKINNHIKIN